MPSHTNVDDTQLHLLFEPNDKLSGTAAVNAMQVLYFLYLTLDMSKLKINDNKNEYLMTVSQRLLSKTSVNSITVGNMSVKAITDV